MNNNNYDNYNHNNKKARYKTIKVMDYLKNLFNPQKWSAITWKQCCKEAPRPSPHSQHCLARVCGFAVKERERRRNSNVADQGMLPSTLLIKDDFTLDVLYSGKWLP